MNYTKEYLEELINTDIDLRVLENKKIVLSGATGLIGSFLVDYILNDASLNVKVICLVRNIAKAKERFSYFQNDHRLTFYQVNLEKEITLQENKVDFVIHAASLTDPLNYSLHPIETMTTNFLGVKNMLDLAVSLKAKFMFLSSCEVYGKNESQNIKEDEYGYVNILDPRACYNESKRASETLCVSYKEQKGLSIVIPRLSRVYGPTMKLTDTKALSQFILKGVHHEDIILKSKGEQLFNYTYVKDIVVSLIILLTHNNGQISYNVNSDELVKLKDIALHIAHISSTKVVFCLPNDIEQKGYSKSLISSMDSGKFKNEYSFTFRTSLYEGIDKTIKIINSFSFKS